MVNKNSTSPWTYLIFLILILFNSCKKDEEAITVTDIDGNIYHTVKIGSQIWMVENLKTTQYLNGDTIPMVSNDTVWDNLKTGAYCYNNNSTSNGVVYGNLYNWYTINDSRGIIPFGWHIPSKEEWETLAKYLSPYGAGDLKETGLIHWKEPNRGATNETGFTALPGGDRYTDGKFNDVGLIGIWWSSTAFNDHQNWCYHLRYDDNSGIFVGAAEKEFGLSIRCIKD